MTRYFHSSIVIRPQIPRLSQYAFEQGIQRLASHFEVHCIQGPVQSQWYLTLASYPDHVLSEVIETWLQTSPHFPDLDQLEQACFKAFPERAFEIDPQATLAMRQKHQQIWLEQQS